MNFLEHVKPLFAASKAAQENFALLVPNWKLSFMDYRESLGEFRIYLSIHEDSALNSSYGFHISEKGLFINNESHLSNPALHLVFQDLEAALGMTIQNWSK